MDLVTWVHAASIWGSFGNYIVGNGFYSEAYIINLEWQTENIRNNDAEI